MARGASREPGWITSLLGAVVLIAGGFLVGLVFGVVSEEPDLVVEHIAGGSEEVAWDAAPAAPGAPGTAEAAEAAGEPVAPDVAAPPREMAAGGDTAAGGEPEVMDLAAAAPEPEPSTARTPGPAAPAPAARPARPRSEAPRAEPAEVAPPRQVAVRAPEGGFAIQVGAFSESDSAERLAHGLSEDGFPTYVTPGAGAGRWRVRVGPFETRERAEAIAGRLEKEQGLPTWVLSEGAR